MRERRVGGGDPRRGSNFQLGLKEIKNKLEKRKEVVNS